MTSELGTYSCIKDRFRLADLDVGLRLRKKHGRRTREFAVAYKNA